MACRSCKAVLRWVNTRAGSGHPCDPDWREGWVTTAPVTTSHRLLLLDSAGDWQGGYLATPLTPGARRIAGYQSHFATCPNAAAHRRRA